MNQGLAPSTGAGTSGRRPSEQGDRGFLGACCRITRCTLFSGRAVNIPPAGFSVQPPHRGRPVLPASVQIGGFGASGDQVLATATGR